MRKTILTLAALAAFGIALPVATTESANAETVVIKQNRGHHYGWRNHHRDRVVIVKKKRYHRDHVVVHEGRRHHGATVGVSVR
jgi:hypothetical protein